MSVLARFCLFWLWFSLLSCLSSDLLRKSFCLPDSLRERVLGLGFIWVFVLDSCFTLCFAAVLQSAPVAAFWSQPSSCLVPPTVPLHLHATNGAAISISSGAHRYGIDIELCSCEPLSRLVSLKSSRLCVRRKIEWFLSGVNLGVSHLGYYWTELRGCQLGICTR